MESENASLANPAVGYCSRCNDEEFRFDPSSGELSQLQLKEEWFREHGDLTNYPLDRSAQEKRHRKVQRNNFIPL
jgi:hypothetical protein